MTDLFEELKQHFSKTDFTSVDDVSVTIENDRLWVDVNGFNVFRAYRIKRLEITDRRGAVT